MLLMPVLHASCNCKSNVCMVGQQIWLAAEGEEGVAIQMMLCLQACRQVASETNVICDQGSVTVHDHFSMKEFERCDSELPSLAALCNSPSRQFAIAVCVHILIHMMGILDICVATYTSSAPSELCKDSHGQHF